MNALSAYTIMGVGLLACVGLEFAGFALATPVVPGQPVLVVAPPWNGGAEAVVAEAGGAVVGPTRAPLAVLAAGASFEAFMQSGAWFLVNPDALGFLCVSEDTV